IHAAAQGRIVLTAGSSRVVLDGGNITFTCPGTFTVKAAAHAFEGGGSAAAELPVLPGDRAEIPHWIELDYRDPVTGQGIGQAQYEIHFDGAPMVSGTLDASGQARHENVAARPVRKIVYKPRPPQDDQAHDALNKLLG
ncbi:MAG: DUF2345 domain-containing protein, partial [Aquabacterium sp.]|nr:DUF2345 domain-containing protein [Aquabacterium sp.]